VRADNAPITPSPAAPTSLWRILWRCADVITTTWCAKSSHYTGNTGVRIPQISVRCHSGIPLEDPHMFHAFPLSFECSANSGRFKPPMTTVFSIISYFLYIPHSCSSFNTSSCHCLQRNFVPSVLPSKTVRRRDSFLYSGVMEQIKWWPLQCFNIVDGPIGILRYLSWGAQQFKQTSKS